MFLKSRMRLGQMYYSKGNSEQANQFFLKADDVNPLSKVAINALKMIEKGIAENANELDKMVISLKKKYLFNLRNSREKQGKLIRKK